MQNGSMGLDNIYITIHLSGCLNLQHILDVSKGITGCSSYSWKHILRLYSLNDSISISIINGV